MKNTEKIVFAIKHKPYNYLLILWFVLFFLINFWVNELYIVGFGILHYDPLIVSFYLFFTFFNTLLIGLNMNLLILKYKELKEISSKSSFVSVVGTFIAFLTGACPGCVAGFFPMIMGIFGSTFTLTSLPFYGVELQFLSFILLIAGTYYLSKDLTCSIDFTKHKK